MQRSSSRVKGNSLRFNSKKDRDAIVKFKHDETQLENMKNAIESGKYVILHIPKCEYCVRAMKIVESSDYEFYDVVKYRRRAFEFLKEHADEFGYDPRHLSVPVIFHKRKFVGGESELVQNKINEIMNSIENGKFVVINIDGCDESVRAMKAIEDRNDTAFFNVRQFRTRMFEKLIEESDKYQFNKEYKSVPTIFYERKFIGGENELYEFLKTVQ